MHFNRSNIFSANSYQLSAFSISLLTFHIFLLTSCMSVQQAHEVYYKKYAPQDLKNDVFLLQEILAADHPSIYWYTPKDSIDAYFSETANSITDSLDAFQFKNKVAWVVSKIRCGHTSVHFSDQYDKAEEKIKTNQFPLAIKTWKDSLIVIADFANDSVLKRGTVITSIDGMNNKQMLDSMFQFISTDGYSDNFKSQFTSFDFSDAYKNAFGVKEKYNISYIDSAKNIQNVVIKNYEHKKDSAAQKILHTKKVNHQKRLSTLRSIVFDTARNAAYMRLSTFSGGQLRSFFRSSFRSFRKNGTQNLIIDLRENGGGLIAKSTLLTKYIVDKNFRIADTVAAFSRKIAYGKYIRNAMIYRLDMLVTSKKEADGRYHIRHFENHIFSPKKKNHFGGNIYIVQGGYTFSAATMFIQNVCGQKNITTVGEETGGGSYGNSSVYFPVIHLPASGLKVVLPLYRIVFDSTAKKAGRGIFPDIHIPPSSPDIKKGVDPKIDFLMKMIDEKRALLQ